MNALRWCEACVLLLPCGRSAHLELGWAAGAGKRTVVIIEERFSMATDVTGIPCFTNGEPSGKPRESLPPYLIELCVRRGRPDFIDAANPYREVQEEEVETRFVTSAARGWEPELMYKMCDLITDSLDVAVGRLGVWEQDRWRSA